MGYVEELRKEIGHRPVILVGVAVLIRNERGELLLRQKKDGSWGLPGGLMELGESAEETGRREVREETGLRLGELKLYSVISGADQHIRLPNGDEFYGVTILFSAEEVLDGEMAADGEEAIELAYFPPDRLPIQMNQRIRAMIAEG